MSRPAMLSAPGPFTVEQIRPDSRYELSDGHPIYCAPTGGRGSRSNLLGGAVLESDPAVESAGIDTGFAPSRGTLRAPDVAVGNVPDTPGWVSGVPPLAVEYADVGQDEDDLQWRIRDFLTRGTKLVWVVRMVGLRRVEVYEPGGSVRVVGRGQELSAPGILQNSVPVDALYERDAAHEATLRNLLQRQGFESLDAVKADGKVTEARAAVLRIFARRGVAVSDAERARIEGCADLDTLHRWQGEAAVAASAEEALR